MIHQTVIKRRADEDGLPAPAVEREKRRSRPHFQRPLSASPAVAVAMASQGVA